jgi:hypothetical protein
MKRASYFFAVLVSTQLLVPVFGLAFPQDRVGHVEKISGDVYWKQKTDTAEVKLNPKKNLRRRLVPGERYRCGPKGKLVLRLYGKRVTIHERMGWFPIPHAAEKGKDPAKQTEAREGAPGGRLVSNPTTVTSPPSIFPQESPARVDLNSQLSYSVVEYPLAKEVTIHLAPVSFPGSKAVGTILRDATGSKIRLTIKDVPPEVNTMNIYAVDDAGEVTSLGPVTLTNGAATFTATTPLSRFMLIAAPDAVLTVYDPNTKAFFRSAVPEGFAVIPLGPRMVGENVGACAAPSNPYAVPMLNIAAYEKGDDTKIKVHFTGALAGARANVFITPTKDGVTKVSLRFHELKDPPADRVFTVWAVSPDNQFVKLGQIVNTGNNNQAEVKSEVALADFGLLVTMEDANSRSTNPMGPAIGIVEIIR